MVGLLPQQWRDSAAAVVLQPPIARFAEHFDGLSDGTAVTDENTAFEEVLVASPHSIVADDAWSVSGDVSALVTMGGSNANAKLAHLFQRVAAVHHVAAYLRFVAVPDSFDRLFTAEDNHANTNVAILTFTSTNTLRCTDGGGNNDTTAHQFTDGEVVRVEAILDVPAGTQTYRFYWTDPDAAYDDFDEQISAPLAAGIPNDWEWGSTNDGTWSFNIDACRATVAAPIGPYAE